MFPFLICNAILLSMKYLTSSMMQASYFVSQGFRRRDERSNMLLSLFSILDRLVGPDRPCHTILWVGIFAFHMALVDQPQDPLVVAAFSLAVHSGGSLLESVEIARRMSQPYHSSFPELLEARKPGSNNALMLKTINFAAMVKTALCNMTDECYVSKAMAKYPKAPSSDLVFIPMSLFLRVSKIFECVGRGTETRFVRRQGRKINYESLARGSLEEVRHVFARIVFTTVYPPNQSNENNVVNQRP
ncbi:hypothetical protein SADUNF_Sadunf03G0125400 [Salix dunnii]|uniref:Uncharacterized protein n=1 Tax=Salix dunnii TaxID=1413687 RepID=A0A835N4I3_9ROSI|nr:hypothetical protein SADUNF_Sadunf03G0125400 [Salix dunnii]